MSAYNHDQAMAAHAGRCGPVTITDEHGATLTGHLLIWRPRGKYRARVRITDHIGAYTYPLNRYTIEPA